MIEGARIFRCSKCNNKWEEPRSTGRPRCCPICKGEDFYRVAENDEAHRKLKRKSNSIKEISG